PHDPARGAKCIHGAGAGGSRLRPRIRPRLPRRPGRRAPRDRRGQAAVSRRMTAILDVMAVRATGDPDRAVFEAEPGGRIEEIVCDVLVVGGGTGGIAAALAAARALPAPGRVVLLEETDWIGGQLTAQGVSALDEHDHIESFGGTRSYYALREAIRD